jgi:hypothetical protein
MTILDRPRLPRAGRGRGQAIAEFALVVPLIALFLFGILGLGLGVFYQQQISNAAREAARYAGIHSSTAQCPTASWLAPEGDVPLSYFDCDRPQDGWPRMVAAGRNAANGLNASKLYISACWSSYWDAGGNYDAPPVDLGGTANTFHDCTIGGVDPVTSPGAIPCPRSGWPPGTTSSDDTGSDQATFTQHSNRVTVYACYEWSPPGAGFLLIPQTFTLRAVVTEVIERQQ